jgi:hypothetical protein
MFVARLWPEGDAVDLCRLERHEEREHRRLGKQRDDSSFAPEQGFESPRRGELSALVAELDEAMEQCAPSPIDRSAVARSARPESPLSGTMQQRA